MPHSAFRRPRLRSSAARRAPVEEFRDSDQDDPLSRSSVDKRRGEAGAREQRASDLKWPRDPEHDLGLASQIFKHIGADGLDHSLFNMDSTCMVRFLDSLAALPGLDGVFWNPEPARGDLHAWVETLRDIRRRGLVVEVMASDTHEACSIARELGPDGLLIALPRFSSIHEAEAAIEEIVDSCRLHRPHRTATARRERT